VSASSAAPPFHRRLHVRIGAVALTVLVLTALALLLLSRAQQQRVSLEVTQRLNLGLARYVLDHQARPLLTRTGEPDRALLMDMAMYVMRANPAVEVYVLDRSGRITGHALDDAAVRMGAVDMGPVRELLRDPVRIELPVLGDDPGTPGARNIFSVAMIGDQAAPAGGYLYIVLRGKAAQGLAEEPTRASAMRQTTPAVLLACGLGAVALLVSLNLLIRPLRRLTAQVQAFRSSDSQRPATTADADEIALLESALRAMQGRITGQVEQVEDNDRMRRELVSNLSHDLQTPLTSIQGHAEHCLLKNDTLCGAERARTLQLMLRHCTSLSQRIGDRLICPGSTPGGCNPSWKCSAWPSCCRTSSMATGSTPRRGRWHCA